MINYDTGRRKRRFPVMLTDDENEYLARKAFSHGTSSGSYVRLAVFNLGWRNELEMLREAQPRNLKQIDSRRK